MHILRMYRCLIALSRCAHLKKLHLQSLDQWPSTMSSFLAIFSQFQKLETVSVPKSFFPPRQIGNVEPNVEPPSNWPPRLTELYMFGRFAPGCLQGISSHSQNFLRVIQLTGSRLRESDVLDMTNEAGCRLQTLEISASAAEICHRNFDCLLQHLPVIRLNIHICTGCVDAEFFGPFKMADESISALRERALDCPKGCSSTRRVNWIDGGKVVSIDSIWSRLSKLAVRREKINFRRN